MESVRAAITRTLLFFEVLGYAPTLPELVLDADVASDSIQKDDLVGQIQHGLRDGWLVQECARIRRNPSDIDVSKLVDERDALQPRKRRHAIAVARWLSRLGGVRFVALANTTALGLARDGGDLDVFVVVRHGSIWTTRLLGGGLYRLLGKLSGPAEKPDAVCLSYFISDAGLNLSSHMLPGDDPYFRYWFLSLLPLYDDGVGQELWEANADLRRQHPFALPWMVSPDLEVKCPLIRLPVLKTIESIAREFQRRWFPRNIRERMNKNSNVLVCDTVLKFHVDDAREEYREEYGRRVNSETPSVPLAKGEAG